jgi:hypothetical protein
MFHRLGEPQEGESAKTTKKGDEHLALVESVRERIDEITERRHDYIQTELYY